MEDPMQTVLVIQSFCQHSWLRFAPAGAYSAPDRALQAIMRERAEQIDAARRYWACPF
jgi:hypothetical protein